jgi:hypothetical protein
MGEKRKQGAMTEVQASKEPNKGGPQRGKGTTKNRTPHQSHEANQLKKGGGKPNKTPSLKEPSPAITTCLEMEATCTLCNAIDTLYLQKESNTNKGRLLVPFVVYAMLAH